MGHGGGIIKAKLAGALLFALAISICLSPLSEGLNNQKIDQNAINSQIKDEKLSNANSVGSAVPLAQVNAATYKKTYKYKKVWSYKYHKYVYVKAAYTYKTTVKYIKSGKKGTGDCWTNSAILLKQLKTKGYKVRIIQYRTSYSARHRSVQIYTGGHWVDYNYKANGYAWRYYATKSKPGLKVIKT